MLGHQNHNNLEDNFIPLLSEPTSEPTFNQAQELLKEQNTPDAVQQVTHQEIENAWEGSLSFTLDTLTLELNRRSGREKGKIEEILQSPAQTKLISAYIDYYIKDAARKNQTLSSKTKAELFEAAFQSFLKKPEKLIDWHLKSNKVSESDSKILLSILETDEPKRAPNLDEHLSSITLNSIQRLVASDLKRLMPKENEGSELHSLISAKIAKVTGAFYVKYNEYPQAKLLRFISITYIRAAATTSFDRIDQEFSHRIWLYFEKPNFKNSISFKQLLAVLDITLPESDFQKKYLANFDQQLDIKCAELGLTQEVYKKKFTKESRPRTRTIARIFKIISL